ncbi:MAG: NrpR regulatory domain-containing protein [Methanobacteriaceae archaeon]
MSESKHKIIEILRILKEVEKPVGAKVIADELNKKGYNLGERAVRYHMQILDEKGFTERVGYAGRKITSSGLSELDKGLAYDQVDFIFSKFEENIYQTSLKINEINHAHNNKNRLEAPNFKASGNIIVNESRIILNNKDSNKRRKIANETLEIIQNISNSRYTVSPLVNIVKNKEESNSTNKTILNIKTICSTTIDGVLLNNGIATNPLYGGLIKVVNGKASHFTQLISYKKTSLTPLDAFIAENMTSVFNVAKTGNGIIPGNIRLIPANAREDALKIFDNLEKVGIKGIIETGKPGESVLGVPVQDNMVGIAIIGGISPLCAVQEANYNVDIQLGEKILNFNELKDIDTISTNNSNKLNKSNKSSFNNSNNLNKLNNKNEPINQSRNRSTSKSKRVQFLLTKAWNLIHNVDFDINSEKGTLITNISYLNKKNIEEAIDIMAKTYKTYTNYINPYYKIVNHPNDPNIKGIATICSFSIDGILINNGIMSTPKYGGLLETGPNPCFVELISYNGSSLDPHEIFIFKNMTSVLNSSSKEVTRPKTTIDNINSNSNNQTNHILASLKEVPFIARNDTIAILDKIKEIGISSYKAGKPRELIYNAKVDNYNFGIVTPSGLNPITAVKESGIDLKVKAVSDMVEFETMEKY